MASAKAIPKAKVVLLDIEGTTTSIAFVKDVLFSYARENLRKYVYDHWEDDELNEVVRLLTKQVSETVTGNKLLSDRALGQHYTLLNHAEDTLNAPNVPALMFTEAGEVEKESIIEYVFWQMDLDRKTYSLKKLQGCIWRSGFISGQLKGHIYDDVVPVLRQWIENGLKLYVFSSGSVEAQRLHFGYSEKGNLLDLFSGHFDTSVGSKIETSSYCRIAEKIGCKPGDILFITDVIPEAEAAAEAGYEVVISERPGNAPISESYRNKFKFIQTFEQLS